MVTDHEMRMEALRLFEENEKLRHQYDSVLTSWAECRDLLSKERAITATLVQSMREIEVYSTDMVAVNGAHAAINATLLAIPIGPACASCKKMPRPDCDNPACAFRDALRAVSLPDRKAAP